MKSTKKILKFLNVYDNPTDEGFKLIEKSNPQIYKDNEGRILKRFYNIDKDSFYWTD